MGLARKMQHIKPMSNEIVTLCYRAPEILLGGIEYGLGVDIWSIGCIMAELFLGKTLFTPDSEIGCIFDIFKLCGTPDEKKWPGVTKLPYYKQSFPRFESNPGFNDVFKEVSIDLMAIDLIKRL